jgi:hypothetical protein
LWQFHTCVQCTLNKFRKYCSEKLVTWWRSHNSAENSRDLCSNAIEICLSFHISFTWATDVTRYYEGLINPLLFVEGSSIFSNQLMENFLKVFVVIWTQRLNYFWKLCVCETVVVEGIWHNHAVCHGNIQWCKNTVC